MNFLQDIASEVLTAILFAAGTWLWIRYKDGRFKQLGKGMRVSPDQSRVVSEVGGDLYVTSDYGTTNLTHTRTIETDAMWASNSRWLAFRRQNGHGWQVWVGDTDTGKLVRLTQMDSPNARPLAWDVENNLKIDLGGSEWIIKHSEIERKLA